MKIVLGVPGAGKSTVLAAVAQERKDYRILNYGTMMSEIAMSEHLISNRDELRKLPLETQKKIQAEVAEKRLPLNKQGKMHAAAAEKLSGMGEKIILDTHCSVKTPDGFLPGLPDRLLSQLSVSALIYITAPPEQIFERRMNDKTRIRTDDPTIESLMEHERKNRELLEHYSKFTGAPIFIIENAKGGLADAQKKLLALLG